MGIGDHIWAGCKAGPFLKAYSSITLFVCSNNKTGFLAGCVEIEIGKGFNIRYYKIRLIIIYPIRTFAWCLLVFHFSKLIV